MTLDLSKFDLHKVERLSPGWVSAVFGAAGAGALLVPNHRVLAGAALGAGVLLFALYMTPCCSGCAGKPVATSTETPPIIADKGGAVINFDEIFATGSPWSCRA